MQEILLLFYANNFLSLANYIALGMLFLFICKDGGRLYIPKDCAFGFLILASLSYMILYIRNFGMPSLSSFFLRFLAPILLYYFGFRIGRDGRGYLKRCVLAIGFGGFIHGLLNIITNLRVNFLLVEGRQYKDIYGGNLSGTLQSLFFVIVCSLLAYFFFEKENKWLKIVGVASVFIALYGSITNASRTLIFLTMIIFFVGILIYQCNEANFLIAMMKTSAIIIVFVFVTMFAIWIDLFHVQEWFTESSLGMRMTLYKNSGASIVHNARWRYTSDILRLLPSNLLGGMDYPHYAHNLWVDVAKDAGVIPFVLYVVFAVLSVRNGFKVLIDRKVTLYDKMVFVPVLLGLFLVFFTEPVVQGSPITFTIFCFIVGGLSSITQSHGICIQNRTSSYTPAECNL